MPGPLPNPNRRRRNVPEPPKAGLPAGGRKGPAPRCPKSTPLGAAGIAWWRWAWKTPQAAAWDTGSLYAVARRATLEDSLAVDPANLGLLRECRELDDRFGLTPKGRAALRWVIVAEDAPEAKPASTVRRLRAVDPSAATG